MRCQRLLPVVAFLAACGGSLPHESPFDESSPPAKQARGEVTLRVVLEGELDAAGVDVMLENTGYSYTAASKADGEVRFSGVVPGAYTLTASTRYFAAVSAPVQVGVGQKVALGGYTLAARRTTVFGSAKAGRLAGKQITYQGGVIVSLQRTGSLRAVNPAPALHTSGASPPPESYTATSDAGGAYSLTGVPAGAYDVVASAPGLNPVTTASIKVEASSPQQLSPIQLEPLTGFFAVEGAVNGAPSTGFTNTPAVTLKLSGFNAAKMRIGVSPDGSAAACVPGAAETYAATAARTLTLQGANTLCVRYLDKDGNETETLYGGIVFDSVAPAPRTVTLNGGAAAAANAVATLGLLAVDGTSGVASYKAGPTSDLSAVNPLPYVTADTISLGGADGLAVVWVSFGDAAGNFSAPVSATIVLDRADPVVASAGLVRLDSGAAVADGSLVNTAQLLLVSSVSDLSPLEMQVSTSGTFSGAAWEPYASPRPVTLPLPPGAGAAARSVQARVRDAAGHIVMLGDFTLQLDTVAPTSPSLAFAAARVSDATQAVIASAAGAVAVELSDDLSFLAPQVVMLPASPAHTFAAGDGTKTLYARFADAAGNYSPVVAASFELDQTPPQNPTLAIAQPSPTNQTPLSLTLSAAGADFMSVTEGACGSVWEAYNQTKVHALASTVEGDKTVAVRFKDAVGNVSACVTQTVYFDATPPSLLTNPVQLNYGAASTSNGTVTVSFNVAGATQVKVSEDSGLADAAWQPLSASRTLALSAGNGTKTVYALFRDDAGNTAGPVNDTIVLDTTPISVPYVTLQAGATSATSVLVTLAASNVDEMMIAESPAFTAAAWQPYVGVTSVTFSGGDGVKTLYAKFRKSSGAESSVASDTYILDTAGPLLPAVRVNNGAAVVSSNIVTLNLTAVDPTSGVAVYKVNTANDFTAAPDHGYQPSDLFTLSAGDGVKTVWVIYRDNAGNYSPAASTSVFLDSTPPSAGAVQLQKLDGSAIANGATVRDGRIVLASSVSDLTTLEMQVTTNGSYAGLGWEPYSPSKVIDLTGASATISARVRDAAGLVTPLVTGYTVNLDNTAPTLTFNRTSASPANALAVSLSLSASETSQAQVSEDPGFTGAVWFNTASTTYTLAAGDGLRTIYARARDAAGNVSDVKTVQVSIDQTAPQGADFTITAGATTNSRTAGLAFTAIGASDVRAQEGACGGTYASYGAAGSVSITSPGDGVKTISVQFKDAVGNETACLTKTLFLDETPPSVTSMLIDGNAPYTTDRVVSVDIVASGATQMQIAENSTFAGASWQPVTSSVAWTLSAGEGAKTIFARFRDDANNVVSGFSDAILVDTIAPTFNSLTAPGASAATGVTLALTAAGADEMRLSENADFTAAAWAPFNALAPFALTSAQGAHTIYAQLRDTAGNVSVVRSVNVTLDSQAPATPLVSVVGGGYTKVATVSIQTVADGASEMLVSQYAPMTDATWAPFAQLKTFVLAGGDGAKILYVKVRDAAGNESGQGSAAVILDATPPAVGLFRAQDSGGNAVTSTNQLRYFLRLDVSDASPVTVQYAPTNVFTGVPGEGYSPLRAWDVPAPVNPAGETRSAYVRIQDAAGNVTVAGPVDVTVDNLGPTAPNLALAAALVSDATVGVTLSAVGANEVELSGDISFLAPVRFAYTTGTSYTFPAGDGVKTLYARYVDAQGNMSAIVVAATTLDQTPPQNPALTISQSSPTNVNPLTLSLSATGADFMSVTENACGSVWESYAQTKALNLGSTVEGTKTVAVRFKDAIGNVSACVTKAVYFDATPPSLLAGALQINYGAASTNSGTVEVEFNVAGATQVKVSEDSGLADAAWMPYTARRTLALSAGNGLKRVYAKFRDDAGNEAGPVNASITLDTTPISVPYVTIQADATSATSVLVSLAASNVDEMMISESPAFTAAAWQPYVGVTSVTFSSGDGVKTLYAKFKKSSGAESSVASDTYILDTTGPQLPAIGVNNGAAVVSSNIVTLNLTAVDPTSGVAVYKVNTVNDFAAAPDHGYQPSDLYTLAGGDGAKTLWAIYRDRAGNYSTAASTTVFLDSTPPALGSVQVRKLDGSAIANGATVRDGRIVLASSVSDLTTLEMQVTTNGSYAGLGWEPYNASKVIDLTGAAATISARVRDAAGQVTTLLTGFTVNLDNTAPTLTFSRTSGSPTNGLAVSLALSASEAGQAQVSEDPGFGGAAWFPTAATTYTLAAGDGLRTIYARVRDAAGNVSDVKTVQVTIDQTPPQLAGFTIDAGAATRFTTNHLTFTALGATRYRVQEGACGGAYQSPMTSGVNFAFTSAGDGVKTVAVQFADDAGNETACLTRAVTLDGTPPWASGAKAVVVNNDDTYATSRSVTLALAVTQATEMLLSNAPSFVGAAWVPFAAATPWTLDAGEGMQSVYAKFRDAAGNVLDGGSDGILVDTVAPANPSVAVNGGASYATTTAVTLTLGYADATRVQVSNDGVFDTEPAVVIGAPTLAWGLTPGDGIKAVYVRYLDDAGNASPVATALTILDTVPPASPSVVINGGAALTSSPAVGLTLSAAGAESMNLSSTSCGGGAWVAYASTGALTLPPGEGAKAVYAAFRDAAGNTVCASSSITVDTVLYAPALDFTLAGPENVAGRTRSQTVTARFAGLTTDVVAYQISNDSAFGGAVWVSVAARPITTAAWALSPGDGVKAVYARVRDAAGNMAPLTGFTRLLSLDQTGPSIPVLGSADLNGDGEVLSNGTVELRWTQPSDTDLAGYTLERLVDGIDLTYLPVGDFAAGTTAYTDLVTAEGSGHRFTYRIRAYDNLGNTSAWSLDLDITPVDPVATVTWVRAQNGSGPVYDYNIVASAGTYLVRSSYTYEDALGFAYRTDNAAGATHWQRPTPVSPVMNEALEVSNANQTDTLSFASSFPLGLRVRESVADATVAPSMAVDDRGSVHLAYVSGTNVQYATNSQGDWKFRTVAAGRGGATGTQVLNAADGSVTLAYEWGGVNPMGGSLAAGFTDQGGGGLPCGGMPVHDVVAVGMGWQTAWVGEAGGQLFSGAFYPGWCDPGHFLWAMDPVTFIWNTVNGQHPSLAVDTSNQMHLTYWSSANDSLQYMTANDPNFLAASAPVTVDAGGHYSRIVIAPGGPMYVAYLDSARSTIKVRTAPLGSSAFTDVTQVCCATDEPFGFALSKNGQDVHLVYRDAGARALKLRYGRTAMWFTQTLDYDRGATGLHSPTVAFDADDVMHVAYYDADNASVRYAADDFRAKYDTVVAAHTGAPAMGADSGGSPVVLFEDPTEGAHTGSGLRVAYRLGGAWVSTLVNAGASSNPALAIDTNAYYRGLLHATYVSGGVLRYQTLPESMWSGGYQLPVSSSAGAFSSVAVANRDAYVAYWDNASGDLGVGTLLYAQSPPTFTLRRLALGMTADLDVKNDIRLRGGTAHLCFVAGGNVRYVTYDLAAGTFTTPLVVDATAAGSECKIVLTSGTVGVAYIGASGHAVRYATISGATVYRTVVDAASSYSGLSAVVDADGAVHLLYQDLARNGLAYANNAGGVFTTALLALGGVAGPTSLGFDGAGIPYAVYRGVDAGSGSPLGLLRRFEGRLKPATVRRTNGIFGVPQPSQPPAISALWPSLIPARGQVEFLGMHFGAAMQDLYLGARRLTSADRWTDTYVVFTPPDDTAAGTYAVHVEAEGQPSNSFNVSITPVADTVTDDLPVGATATLAGYGFGSDVTGNTLWIDGAPVTAATWGRYAIGFVLPATLDFGEHTAAVTVNGFGSNTTTFRVAHGLDSVSPARLQGGNLMTLSGSNFGGAQGSSHVYLGQSEAVIVSWSNTQIVAVVPGGVPFGVNTVRVVRGGVTRFQSVKVDPRIVSTAPAYVHAGDTVTVSGYSFSGSAALSLLVGNTPVLISSIDTASVPNTLTFVMPGGFVGASISIELKAVEIAGTPQWFGGSLWLSTWGSSSFGFYVWPEPGLRVVQVNYYGNTSWGPPGTVNVQVHPPGAAPFGSTAVVPGGGFGGTALPTFAPGSDGSGNWFVTANYASGTFGASANAWLNGQVQFGEFLSAATTVAAAPSLTALAPNPILAGGTLHLSGSGLSATLSSVTVGGVSADVLGLSGTLDVRVPALASGRYDVQVSTYGIPSNTLPVDVLGQAPTLSALAPTSGTGNDTVTLIGAGFGPAQGAGEVLFNGTNAVVQSWSDTSIVVTVPGIVAMGTAEVIVTVGGGGVSNPQSFIYVAPLILSRSPGWGFDGDSVTIRGAHFGATPGMVLLGEASVTVLGWSDTAVTIATNTGVLYGHGGRVTLQVRNAGGVNSNKVSFKIRVGSAWVPLADRPLARTGHAAVWTGREMLVVGGRSGNGQASQGARYNPATDTWLPMAYQYGSLYATEDMAAVWTGARLYVVGGRDNASGPVGLAWYDPALDQWGYDWSVSARYRHAAVWTGSEIVAWGGTTTGFNALASGYRYNPYSGESRITTLTGAPTARQSPGMVWTGSEAVVWGGNDVDGGGNPATFFATGARYNPRTDVWQAMSTAGAPAGRAYGSFTWAGGRAVVFGGAVSGATLTNGGAFYDPAADAWAALASLGAPTPRGGHLAVAAGAKLLVWGGCTAVAGDCTAVANDGAALDVAANTWSAIPVQAGTPAPRLLSAGVYTGSELLVWGGQDTVHELGDGARYDVAAQLWLSMAAHLEPDPVRDHVAVWTGAEMVVWGGCSALDASGENCLAYTNHGARYNPATATWLPTATSGAPDGVVGHTAVWLGNKMLVWGGTGAAGATAAGAAYDPALDSWSALPASGLAARRGHTVVASPGEMIVWGGFDASDLGLADGARYNPALGTWSAVSATGAPAARGWHSAVYGGDQMIVFGGQTDLSGSPTVFNTGASYDPLFDVWTALPALDQIDSDFVGMPFSAGDEYRTRHRAVMVGDRMIIFGGASSFDRGFLAYHLTDGKWGAQQAWLPDIQNAGDRTGHVVVAADDVAFVFGGGTPSTGEAGAAISLYNSGGIGPISYPDPDMPARRGATGVWTGREVIVFGGSSGGKLLSGGGMWAR